MNGLSIIAALAIVYLWGYVTGSLLVAPEHDRTKAALAVVRLLAGLFLSSITFLLSLEFGLPWFAGPSAAFIVAALVRRHRALIPPHPALTWNGGTVAAVIVAVIALAPPVISATRMASGSFPPVFFNVDMPYFLEKVHTLTVTQMFPPESLSVAGGRRPYHFGLHGIAALISRATHVLPHQVAFGMLVPMLTAGIIAAAFVLARSLAPAVPAIISIPLLVVAVPTLWQEYWSRIGPSIRSSLTAGSMDAIAGLVRNWEVWGLTSNIQNLGGHFLVLASLAAIVNASTIGWSLAMFLVGSAVIFKSPAGVALMGGFAASQAYRALASRSVRPLWPVIGASAVFAVVYGAFWLVPRLPAELKLVFSPFFQMEYVARHGVGWFTADILWLLVPGLVAFAARPRRVPPQTIPLLIFALVPFIVVNVFRIYDMRRIITNSMNVDDWRQVIMVSPVLLHAAALSILGSGWMSMTRTMRAVCIAAVTIVVLPPAIVSLQYSQTLLVDYEHGHEFADNHAIAAALGAIPTVGTLIVTNDLRYPADAFQRDQRQMQIPALFGHQAFAVNYVYEAYDFSRQRLELQQLLKANRWSPAIDAAARQYHWTHLLIRKDYPHPDPIPLERIFDNEFYSVFRF